MRKISPSVKVTDGKDEILLKDIHIINPNTIVSGPYERAFKELDLELKLISWYEPVFFKIPTAPRLNGEGKRAADEYPPDFITRFFIGGKQVIIELHNGNRDYLNRMGRFRKTYGDRFYYILVRSVEGKRDLDSIDVRRNARQHVDECWHMPYVFANGRGKVDEAKYALWKKRMKVALRKLEARTDKGADWEVAASLINVKRAS